MNRNHPFYFKSTMIILGLVLLAYIFFQLRTIIVPIAFSLLIAILLNPVCGWLQRRGIPFVWSIMLTLLLASIVCLGIGYFLSMQIMSFSDELPLLKQKLELMFGQLQRSIASEYNIPLEKQAQWIAETKAGMKPLIGQAIGTVLGVFSVVFLLPVYIFLFLYYKTLLLNFLYEIFAEENSKEVALLLGQTKSAIQHFMVGLLMETLVVAVLDSTALLILGVDYAILIGIIGAILNILPYIGGIIAIALPLTIATVTHDGFHTQLWILISYMAIQFIDNHFLMPYLVSSKIKINALFSIVIVLLGGAIWGVSGMFLSIPFIGILKLIFDRIPELKPWGKLLGDDVPVRHRGEIWRLRKRRGIKAADKEMA